MNAHAAAQTRQDPRIGMVLQERYRILRKLGDGGMGSVYEAEHLLIKRRVAIKVLHSQFADNPGIVARFRREAEAATSIGHPNIIEVTDMGSFPDGTTYMVLEFLEGRDWAKDIATEGPQPLGKIVHIMSQVCDALSAAHAKGIVHRDLKPENIFLIQRGADRNFAKVLDFGISKFADSGNENRSLTQTGTALGTPYYMAPEQCQGKKDIDHRADIYSLGVILFQALTRQYPFDDESYPMLVLKICTEPPPPLAYYRPDLPPAMVDVVSRMLAKDRNYRFNSCEELKAALEPFRHVNAAPVLAADAPSTASRGPSVLERAVSPASTPAAYAGPSFSAPAPAEAPAPNSRGLMWAVIAVLFVIVLAGGTLGALLAFGVLDPNPAPVATNTEPEVPRAGGQPSPPPEHDDPADDPAAQGTEVEPATTGAPTVPSTPAVPMVRVRVTVTGPSTAQVFINGREWGSTPLDIEMQRDPPPAPDAEPILRTLEVRADGWETVSERISFATAEVERSFTMRARTRHTTVRQQPTIQPVGGPGPGTRSGGPVPRDTIIRPSPPPPTRNDLLRPF